jgi:hypothetical protein
MCKKKPIRNYRVIKDGGRYTIGEWDEGYRAYIVNDGICQYYIGGTLRRTLKRRRCLCGLDNMVMAMIRFMRMK